jgi:hypothetical protein
LKTLKRDELFVGTLLPNYCDEQTDVKTLLLQGLNNKVLHQFVPGSITNYDVIYEQGGTI